MLEEFAKKFGIDLEAEDVAGSEASFASIEATAAKVGRLVTRHLIEDLAIKQTRLLDEPQPCPDCERLCKVTVRDRPLTTAEGPVKLSEAVCHCSACRRDFFPSTRPTEASPTRF